MTMSYRQFESLRVGDALRFPPLRVPPEWNKKPFLYRKIPEVRARLHERERDQAHRCAICKTSEPGGKHNNLNMDHCHDRGFVRSMLCLRCNVVRPDCAADAERLAAYLRFWESMLAFYDEAEMLRKRGKVAVARKPLAETEATARPAPKRQLLTGIEAASSRPVRRIVLRDGLLRQPVAGIVRRSWPAWRS